MKKLMCLLLACFVCVLSYGKTTPVMAKEKEKTVIVTGCEKMVKVVAIAFLKMDVVMFGFDLPDKQNKSFAFESNKNIYSEFEPIKINDYEVREKPNDIYKFINLPINSKPFKTNIKFDRTARNAI